MRRNIKLLYFKMMHFKTKRRARLNGKLTVVRKGATNNQISNNNQYQTQRKSTQSIPDIHNRVLPRKTRNYMSTHQNKTLIQLLVSQKEGKFCRFPSAATQNNHSCLTLLGSTGIAVDPVLVGTEMGLEEMTFILPGLVGLTTQKE